MRTVADKGDVENTSLILPDPRDPTRQTPNWTNNFKEVP